MSSFLAGCLASSCSRIRTSAKSPNPRLVRREMALDTCPSESNRRACNARWSSLSGCWLALCRNRLCAAVLSASHHDTTLPKSPFLQAANRCCRIFLLLRPPRGGSLSNMSCNARSHFNARLSSASSCASRTSSNTSTMAHAHASVKRCGTYNVRTG